MYNREKLTNESTERERDDVMATSTFGKEFKVERKVASSFVKEMQKQAPPTLDKNFETKLTHVKDAKPLLDKVFK